MTNLRDAIARNRILRRKSPSRRRKKEEGDFQSLAVDVLELVLPLDAICTSIDHAAAASAAVGADRKRRGVLPGIPDILVTWSPDPRQRLCIVVWFECKARSGVLKVDQEAFRVAALAQGQYWSAPRTIEDVLAALRETPIPLRQISIMPSGASYIRRN